MGRCSVLSDVARQEERKTKLLSSDMSDFSTLRTMMVDTQVRPSDVTKFPIIEAMLSVPREAYVPAAKQAVAYVGECVDLGQGRVLVEARTLAKMLDALTILPTDKVLDIGGGLGYSAAVVARMASSVIAVEDDSARVDAANAAFADQGIANAKAIVGELNAGAASAAPFDVIIVNGGVHDVPEPLLAQLAEGGRIAAVFMQGALGTVKIGHKVDGRVAWRFGFNAAAPVLPGFARAEVFAL